MCLGFVYDVYVPQSDEVALSAKIGITKTTANPVEIDMFVKFHGTRNGTNTANAKCRGR